MPKRNLAWLLVVVVIALLFWRMPQNIAGRDSLYSAFGPLLEARAEILRRSAENVEDGRLTAAATSAGIAAMIRELHDPHAMYLDREAYAAFRKRAEGAFAGIGVDVRMASDGLRVVSVVRDGPAARAGVTAGDCILAIGGLNTTSLGLVECVNLLNGPPDTKVELDLRSRAGGRERLSLRRADIEINPVRGLCRDSTGASIFVLDSRRRIGYVRLVRFLSNSARQLDSVVEPLLNAGLRGLVLDLRENAGGLLRCAIDVADRFLDAGLIVTTRGPRSDAREYFAQREDTYRPMALVVLVNRNTASAAEIVAGALQDHHRAAIVGERTYGKGTMQELIPLEDGQTAVKITTGFYFLPSGRCIQRSSNPAAPNRGGIEPDVSVPLAEPQREKWLDVWQWAGLEADEEPPSVEEAPVTDESAPTSRPATKPAADAGLLRTLLDADPQLRRALSLLADRLDGVRATRPARGTTDAHAPGN